LKTHYESEIQALKEQHQNQITANEVTEGQMADHILQNEAERRDTYADIISLVIAFIVLLSLGKS
jgi:hypothetical protein